MKKWMLLALIALLPIAAQAGNPVEVTPFYGYMAFEEHQNLDNNPLAGLRLGYNVNDLLGIEASGEFIHTQIGDLTREGQGQYVGQGEVNLLFYHIDAVFNLHLGNLNPFVTLGVGGTHYDRMICTGEMTTFDAGIGAKYWLTENIALRMDVRSNIVTELGSMNNDDITPVYLCPSATLGLTLAFGGEPKAQEPQTIIQTETIYIKEELTPILGEIYFDFDEDILTYQAVQQLNEYIDILKENPEVNLYICGHACEIGTTPYNQNLSERRADAVMQYLIEGGIAPSRLTTVGNGTRNQARTEVNPADTESQAAKTNRRVTLFQYAR